MKNLFVSLLLILITATSWATDGKYALIIGNDNYIGDFKPLPTCVNDAKEMDRCLKKLGYATTVLLNATRQEIMDAMDAFESKTQQEAAVGIFFYSGHAVTMHGEPYIIPSNTSITKDNGRLKEYCVGVGSIKKMMKNRCEKSILFLDACRNIVDDETKGASIWMKPKSKDTKSKKSEQIVCFATALDDVARPGNENLSPFTHVLCSHLFDDKSFQAIWTDCIEKEVNAYSGQSPTWEGTFTDLFYFNPQHLQDPEGPKQSIRSIKQNYNIKQCHPELAFTLDDCQISDDVCVIKFTIQNNSNKSLAFNSSWKDPILIAVDDLGHSYKSESIDVDIFGTAKINNKNAKITCEIDGYGQLHPAGSIGLGEVISVEGALKLEEGEKASGKITIFDIAENSSKFNSIKFYWRNKSLNLVDRPIEIKDLPITRSN